MIKRQSKPFALVMLPRKATESSYEWLRNAIRTEILQSRLKPGSRLPSTREIARIYKLSRGTVVSAMEDLKAQGYIYGVAGSGTFVCDVAPDQFLKARRVPQTRSKTGELSAKSQFAKRLKPISHFIDSTALAFRTNLPALNLFPTTLWAQVASRRLRRLTQSQLLGCMPGGYEPLRSAVAQYLVASRGVVCRESQIVIVSGVQEALDLTARILLNEGDRVLIEDPGYQVAYAAFEAAGASVVPVPVDSFGAAPTARTSPVQSCST